MMTVLRGVMVAAGVAAAALGSMSCSPPTPIGEITLSSVSGQSTHLVGGNGTFALAEGQLAPPALDPPGTTHFLFFDFPNTAPVVPRQEVVAFDIDWAGPVFSPDPTMDYFPVFPSPPQYVSVPAETLKAYNFQIDRNCCSTSHLVRYWHGRCSAKRAWGPIFDQLLKRTLDRRTSAGS